MLTKPFIKNILERLRNPDPDLPNDLSAITAASILVFGLVVSLLFIVTILVTKLADVICFALFTEFSDMDSYSLFCHHIRVASHYAAVGTM